LLHPSSDLLLERFTEGLRDAGDTSEVVDNRELLDATAGFMGGTVYDPVSTNETLSMCGRSILVTRGQFSVSAGQFPVSIGQFPVSGVQSPV
jgi:hypothetical protein